MADIIPADGQPAPSRLQGALVRRILALIQANEIAPGSRVTEVGLADRLQVSRTPVRAALTYLEAQGVVERRTDRVLVVAAAPDAAALPGEPPVEDLDRLFVAVAQDRLAGRLPAEISEADLMRRYGVPRRTLQRLLDGLAELSLVERKAGNGWRFLPAIDDAQTRAESYRFRRMLEPTALLEPGFRIDAAWLDDMRRRHDAAMATPWRDAASSVAFFEMNAAFHEGLAAASGNRFLLGAIQQQNRLRRFCCYDWIHGHERVVVSCVEHIQIMDRLAEGDREVAAVLLRRHLEGASSLARTLRTVT